MRQLSFLLDDQDPHHAACYRPMPASMLTFLSGSARRPAGAKEITVSFHSQCDQRIDMAGATRGNPCAKDGEHDKRQRNGDEDGGIAGR